MSNGQEFYPSVQGKKQKYAIDHKNNERYVTEYKKDLNNNQIYDTLNGKQVYAVDSKGVPYYAKMANQSEYYGIDLNRNQYYIKTKDGEIFAVNEKQEQTYATKANGDQFYAKTKHGRPKFVQIGNRQIYAMNRKGDQLYPRNSLGKCIIAKDNDRFYYAKSNDNTPTYPTDENNNQFVVNNTYITDKNGDIVLPIDHSGFPIYEKDKDGNEIYKFDHSGRPIFGKDLWGEQIYAKTKDLNEFYPFVKGEPVFAKKNHQMDKYALDSFGGVSYPQNKNNEMFYIEGSNEMLKEHFTHYIPGKYPKNASNGDVLILNVYATNESGRLFYPKDSFENQYVRDDTTDPWIDYEYPVTNDGYVIVPNRQNEPLYCDKGNVTENNIVALLFRSNGSYDFLTNVQTTIPKKKRTYKTISLTSKKKIPTFQYVIFIIMLLLLLLLI